MERPVRERHKESGGRACDASVQAGTAERGSFISGIGAELLGFEEGAYLCIRLEWLEEQEMIVIEKN